MITVSRFITSKLQDEKVQAYKPEVPNFWGGFYAVYKPKKGEQFWVKRWHSSKAGKTIKNAAFVIGVESAHQKWNEFLNK